MAKMKSDALAALNSVKKNITVEEPTSQIEKIEETRENVEDEIITKKDTATSTPVPRAENTRTTTKKRTLEDKLSKKNIGKLVSISCKIDPDMDRQLRSLTKEYKTTKAELIKLALKEFLENYE